MKRWISYSMITAAAGLLLNLLSRNLSGFGEWYGRHIFPVFPNTAGRLLSLFPFSVFEFSLYILVGVVLFFIGWGIFYFIKNPKLNWKAIQKSLCVLSGILASLFLILNLACSVNYGRESVANLIGLEMGLSGKAELQELSLSLIDDARKLESKIDRDENGLFCINESKVGEEAKAAMKKAGSRYEILDGYYPNPKPVLFSEGMSYLNLTGLYSPFTIEANYNTAVVDYVIPYTICHELAHLRGFIREDEAGFLAYVACAESDNPRFQYSGTLNALIYCLNALYNEMGEEEYRRFYTENMPKQVYEDLHENALYWQDHQTKSFEIGSKINDVYLKANAQTDGVKSYGRMVDLLLAYHKEGWKLI